MVDDLLTQAVQIAGNLTGMGIKYGLLMALPGIMGALAAAPITLTAAGIAAGLGAMGTIGSAVIFVAGPTILAMLLAGV